MNKNLSPTAPQVSFCITCTQTRTNPSSLFTTNHLLYLLTWSMYRFEEISLLQSAIHHRRLLHRLGVLGFPFSGPPVDICNVGSGSRQSCRHCWIVGSCLYSVLVACEGVNSRCLLPGALDHFKRLGGMGIDLLDTHCLLGWIRPISYWRSGVGKLQGCETLGATVDGGNSDDSAREFAKSRICRVTMLRRLGSE